jgi:hypothetical protein
VQLKAGEFLSPKPKESGLRETTSNRPEAVEKLGLAIDASLLVNIEDNTMWIRRDEAYVYLYTLAKARNVPEKQLRQAAIQDVGYARVMVDSNRFRGIPITIEGDLRRLLPLPINKSIRRKVFELELETNTIILPSLAPLPIPNFVPLANVAYDAELEDLLTVMLPSVTFGPIPQLLPLPQYRLRKRVIYETVDVKQEFDIDQLYEAWIFTPESGKNPYRVVCTSLPSEIPQGEWLEKPIPIRVTGYFLKRCGYSAPNKSGFHIAPLLLSKSLQPISVRTSTVMDLWYAPYVFWFVILVIVLLVFSMWRFSIGTRKFHNSTLKRLTEAPQESIAALDGIHTEDINDLLRQMAESTENDQE